MNKFKGLLFDLDGTLVKTMEEHFNAWNAILRESSIEIKEEDYYPLEGMRLRELAKKLFELNNLEPSDSEADELVRKKDEYYLERYTFQTYAGVEQIVDDLKSKGIPIGIVTAGLANRVDGSIPSEFSSKFDVIITGETAECGKPFPDPYLKGAEALGLSPEEVIVVENAPLGIRSAKSAGAYCIAICSTLNRDYLKESDEIVENFEDLKNLSVIKNLK